MEKVSYNFIISNIESRTEDWQGQKYLVVPVIAMVEGVHHGSGGPVFYPGEEISKFTESWNGRPLPVFHPTALDGTPISCNDPDIIASQSVGHTFNFYYEDGKLKGEAWINIDKAKEIAPEILSIIQAHDRLEVSTGLFSDPDLVPGEWNGEAYDAVMRNYRPDHLALLPGGRGACSWEDGCGIRANSKSKIGGKNMADDKSRRLKDFWANMGNFFSLDASHDEIRQAIQLKIDVLDNSRWVHYVKKVYDDYFVYQAMPTNPSPGQAAILWRQSYSIVENEVEFGEETIEVKEEITYKPVNNTNGVGTNAKGEKTMAKDKKCCPEKVQSLIENEATKFTEDDREWLEGLSEPVVDKLMPDEKTEVQKTVAQTAQDILDGKLPQQSMVFNSEGMKLVPDKKEDEKNPNPTSDKTDGNVPAETETVDEYIANAPMEMQDVLKSGLAMVQKKKEALVNSILASKRNVFTKDELEVLESDQLERIAALAGEAAEDFSANSGVINKGNAEKVEPLSAPTFEDYAPSPNS